MCKERLVFIVAGSMVGLSALLVYFVSPWWLIMTAFVAINMIQAGLTGFCPLTKVLNALKVERCETVSPLN